VRRLAATLVGVLLIAGAAVIVGKFLFPAKPAHTAKGEGILSKEYAPRLRECRFLEDTELPEGVEPPEVGAPEAYLLVVVLYPGVAAAPKSTEFALDRINGHPQTRIEPVSSAEEVDDAGAAIHLVFLARHDFQYGRVTLDGKPVLEKIVPQS
jgi:hypothetical protein